MAELPITNRIRMLRFMADEMTQAELAWMRFRDAEVEFAGLAARREQEAAYGKTSTLAGVTGARAQDLGEIVKEIKSH